MQHTLPPASQPPMSQSWRAANLKPAAAPRDFTGAGSAPVEDHTARSYSSLPGAPPLPADVDCDLDQAIRASLKDSEEQRRKEKEEARKAVEVVAAEEERRRREEAQRPRFCPPPPGLARQFAQYQWLTDAGISFFYSRLMDPGIDGGACCNRLSKLPETVLLMDPATAFWLGALEDPAHVEEARRDMRLQERELVLCPVNDSREVDRADGGTHWGLLVWDRQGENQKSLSNESSTAYGTGELLGLSGRFVYYDSGSGYTRTENLAQARILAGRLAGAPTQVSIGACAKQTNWFDCGMYVLVFSEIVTDGFLEGKIFNMEDKLLAVTPEEVAKRRTQYHAALTKATAAAAAGA